MLTSHLTLKRIFEKNAVFWAWCGQNTAKFPTACLKMGSKMGEIGRIWVRKVAWMMWDAFWDQIFFLRKSGVSEHGVAKTQLNSTIYASKRGPNWVNSVEFGWKKWRRWCGKPFGIISEHKKISKKIHFFDPHTHADPPTDPSCVVISGFGNWAVSRASRHLRGSDCFQKHFSFKDLFQKYC